MNATPFDQGTFRALDERKMALGFPLEATIDDIETITHREEERLGKLLELAADMREAAREWAGEFEGVEPRPLDPIVPGINTGEGVTRKSAVASGGKGGPDA